MKEVINRIQELVSILNNYSYQYYILDKPEVEDKIYDQLYEELLNLEKESNFILSSSPTQKVQGEVIDFFGEIKHTELMLSADKSKDIEDVIKFMNNQKCILSWKLDGLTLVLRYDNGVFKQAITRGGGDSGEDVTHTVKTFTNIPLTINYKGYLEIRGEGLVLLNEFERINSELIANNEEPYSNARSLAAGSVRQLNANITKNRNLIFIAFGVVKCNISISTKVKQFDFLYDLGFDVVEHDLTNSIDIGNQIEYFKSKLLKLPFLTDGLIIEFNDIKYGKEQGFTGHHTKNMYALKWNDDSYETTFREVERNTTRTGIVSLTAIYDKINIDGTKTTRASLHNYDIFEKFQFGVGDKITVYKANGVIPQIENNLTRSNTYKIEMRCPACGAEIEIRTPKIARFLYCTNDNCPAKMIDKFTHFVSKKGFNIEGLSEKTIEKFINKKFIKEFSDIFKLDKYKNQIIQMDGFGQKSYQNLIKAIEKSKNIELHKFIFALGIPQIGEGGAKQLSKYFDNNMEKIMNTSYIGLMQVKDFGDVTAGNVYEYFNHPDNNNKKMVKELLNYVNIKIKNKEENKVSNSILEGKTVCITGKLSKSRDEYITILESCGAKFINSVSKKTNFLLIGENVGSVKTNKAKECGTQIITENEFMQMVG